MHTWSAEVFIFSRRSRMRMGMSSSPRFPPLLRSPSPSPRNPTHAREMVPKLCWLLQWSSAAPAARPRPRVFVLFCRSAGLLMRGNCPKVTKKYKMLHVISQASKQNTHAEAKKTPTNDPRGKQRGPKGAIRAPKGAQRYPKGAHGGPKVAKGVPEGF